MPNNQFINLEELSKTTQALLSKINEQSNLKVNKNNVKAELETGTKIGNIEGIEFYAPEVDTSNFLTYDNLNLANVAFSGDYNDLNNKPTLATVATTNNYNDLSYRPALAIVATSGSYNDLNNKPTIPNVPNWALQSTKPTYTATEIKALPSSSNTVHWDYGYNNGLTLFIGNSASDGGIKGAISLANSGDSAYYTVITPTATTSTTISLPSTTGTLALTSDIAAAIGNINQFEVAIVTNLPTTDIDTHTIYFKSNSSSGNNVYDEYMYINNNWELIGSTQVDLSGYALSANLATVATSGDYDDLIDAPVAESDTNVETMLNSFNLDYTNNTSSPNYAAGVNF